jgi:tripartite-type tricarboxylate transporter receptor subunit TctC
MLALSALPMLGAGNVARAQDAGRPVRIVVPFAPSGFPDRIARQLVRYLGEDTQVRYYVENRPGAGGILGSAEVANAPPDGTNLLISSLPSQVLAPLINPRGAVDPIKSFTHIAYIGGPPTAFVVPAASPLKTFDDLIKTAKAKGLTYQTGGAGTVGHLIAEYVKEKSGTQLIHVPYNGPMMTDLLSGVVDFASLAFSTAVGQIEGGKLRVLAVGSDARLPDWPDIPTFKEAGFDISALSWLALSGPAGMPDAMVKDLNQRVIKIMARPELADMRKQEVIVPRALTPAELTAQFEADIARWKPVVQAAGLAKQ